MRLLFNVLLVTSLLAVNHIRWIEADVSPDGRKINLEDIERDTLINEIRSKSQETLQAEPTEHVPPTSVSGPVQQQQQHVQHTGPSGQQGAVSHQTIVYHQTSGDHQDAYNSHNQAQQGPTGPQLQSGITYAQAGPQYAQAGPQYAQSGPQYSHSGPGQTIHYSHSSPAVAPAAYVQHQIHSQPQIQQIHAQPQIHHGPPQLLTHQPVVYYSHNTHYPQEPVQYVNIQPPHHISHNLIAPQVPQVHEEGRTYSAPSRHSLEVNTQQQKHFKSQPPRTPVGFRPKPALITPQPQYVYVQANNVASAQQQRQYQQKLQQAPQKVQNVEIIPSQGQQIGQTIEYIPQQSGVSYSQSTPYFQYSGSFGHQQAAIPAHQQQSLPVNNYIVVPYATGPNVYQHQAGPAPALAPPQQYEIPHYVNPTKALIPNGGPGAAPQVLIQPAQAHSYVGPVAQYHAHPHPQQTYQQISYAPAHPGSSFGYNHHGQAYSNYYQPTLDFFGGYARHTSLLDSYVPSNLIYSKSRQIYNQYYAPPAAAPVPHHHHHHPSASAPVETGPQSSVYNTIAYSTEQKPVVVAPPPLAKRESTVLKASGSAPKPTIATKVETVKITKQH